MLNFLSSGERARIVTSMLENFSDEDILKVVKNLSIQCFEIMGAYFFRKGATSFLADIIKAYVEQYDGVRFVQAYHDQESEGLRNFKFSQQSTAVFALLWGMALAKDEEKGCQDYTNYLPENICNKIWGPMILDRFTLNRTASMSVIMRVGPQMQSLAKDKKLLEHILRANIGDPKDCVERQDGGPHGMGVA